MDKRIHPMIIELAVEKRLSIDSRLGRWAKSQSSPRAIDQAPGVPDQNSSPACLRWRPAPATPRHPHQPLPLLPPGPDGVHDLAMRGDRCESPKSGWSPATTGENALPRSRIPGPEPKPGRPRVTERKRKHSRPSGTKALGRASPKPDHVAFPESQGKYRESRRLPTPSRSKLPDAVRLSHPNIIAGLWKLSSIIRCSHPPPHSLRRRKRHTGDRFSRGRNLLRGSQPDFDGDSRLSNMAI